MHILFLNYEYPPVGSGGGIISKYIAEGLTSRTNKVTVLTTWFEGLLETEYVNNLTIIRIKSKRSKIYQSNPSEMLSWIKESKSFLDNYCKDQLPALCFANFVLPGGAVALYLKRKFNVRYVLLSHGHDVPWVKPVKLYIYYCLTYKWLKKICLNSEMNFIQSSQMKANIDSFIGKKNSKKNIIISNGVEPSVFHPDYTKRDKIFRIIFVGRLVTQKDPLFFLRIIKKLSAVFRDFSAHIYGDGPLRKTIENYIINNKLSNNVKIHRHVPLSEMSAIYQMSHLIISPSVSEGMSLSNLEAIACGTYVLTTRASGNPEMINQEINGEIISSDSPDYWVERIIHFYNNKFLLNYLTPNDYIVHFHNKFNWNNIIDEYESNLNIILTAHSENYNCKDINE
ncbi:MAG: glycosyltransferase family 4 protein [Bacteroidia bacterium]|nr:glycosyltransferase family 4 protein [Bacteroidia bacterium]